MINVHSYFSFKYGLYAPAQLVRWAVDHHYKALALTDINSTAGSLDFVRLACRHGIRPLLGIDFRAGARQQFVGLARDNEGFRQLNALLSGYLHGDYPLPSEAGRIAGCFILYPPENLPRRPLKEHEYIAVRPYEMRLWRLRDLPRDKLVACPVFTLPESGSYDLHCVLRAIGLNTLVSKLQDQDTAHKEDVFLPKAVLLKAYERIPEAIENLKKIVSACDIRFDFVPDARPQNLSTWSGSEQGDYVKVRQLCLEGLGYRYGSRPAYHIRKRVVRELRTIRQMGFLSYFLISWDMVRYARDKGYYYVGRGSGANSLVAYLLRITDVDPVDLDLYFERFINLFRQNPPDFDIDFSSRDRDDVIRYLFERYPHVVLLATHSTFQSRSVTREVGKAFGVPPEEIDQLQQSLKNAPGKEPLSDGQLRRILDYGRQLKAFPSHLSVHAGGVIISERPIHYFTATSLPPKGFPITHFDMHIAEDVGLYKFDVLAQRGLGKIRDALAIIRANRPDRPEIDIHDVKFFFDDPLVRTNLREANAIGCFYIESPAMRMLLTKLKADDYLTLVAASSVIRPGVAKSGMMRQYILRYRVPDRRKEAHPILRQLMPETYGVMVYQEDVIKVAHYFAGLTLAEADVLRRGMSGKYRSRSEFVQVRDRFFQNCRDRGHDPGLTADIWRQIESFAGYAFAKGHSASYAIESYQSLYLKSHYPREFMVAVLNNGGGFYSREFYVHEAARHGAVIELPCLNKSRNQTIIEGKTIFLGLGMIKGLEDRLITETIAERERGGCFRSMEEYMRRVSISLEQLSILIRVGALRFAGQSKKELLWRAHFLLTNTGKSETRATLFEPAGKTYTLPALEHTELEHVYDQMELLGFPLISPFRLLEDRPEGCTPARDFPGTIGRPVRSLGYLVTVKRTITSGGKRMYFGNFLDEEGAYIDTVHFPAVAERYPFNGKGIYLLEGTVVEEFDAISLEVCYMKKLHYLAFD